MSSLDGKEAAHAHIDYVEAHKIAAKPVVGTIKLYDEDGIVLIPTPTRDPNGTYGAKTTAPVRLDID